MIFNEIKKDQIDKSPVLIIGSGPAGISLAIDLAKKNINSIIIEAGEEFYSEESQSQYDGKIIGDPLEQLSESRLRQLGGTSGIWGGWSRPLENYDFLEWPISKKDIEPYLDGACSILNIPNKFRSTNLNKEINQIEYQYSQVRFGDHYNDFLRKTKKIKIFLNSQFDHFESIDNKITHAIIKTKNGEIKLKSQNFVLATGGIENSRILLWSRIKNPNLLDKKLPIGKYWMSHPFIYGGQGIVYKQKIKKSFQKKFINVDDSPIHFTPSENFLKSNNILSSSIHIEPSEDKEYTKKQILRDIACLAPKLSQKIRKLYNNKDLLCGNIKMHLQENYDMKNSVTLDSERDNFNIPKPVLNYTQSPTSVLGCKKLLIAFANLCLDKDIGRISVSDEIMNGNKIKEIAQGGYHHCGGTVMGESIKTSVVNSDLKVHNTDNLYVLGSSIFTSVGYVNPTLSIVQFSLRLSNFLKLKLS